MSNDQCPNRDTMPLEEATASNMREIAAIGKMFERESLCTKQDGYDIIAEFRRKNPLFELGPKVCRLWYSPLGLNDRIRRRRMTRHGKQYGAIVMVLVGLVALPGGGQAQQQELTRKDGAPMVLVPAGEFTMWGNEAVEEKPVHQVSLDAYYIDKYEVTVGQYAKFLESTSRKAPPEWKIMNQPSHQQHPVVMMDWSDANRYCHWAEKRLPTEAEWEKAARGT